MYELFSQQTFKYSFFRNMIQKSFLSFVCLSFLLLYIVETCYRINFVSTKQTQIKKNYYYIKIYKLLSIYRSALVTFLNPSSGKSSGILYIYRTICFLIRLSYIDKRTFQIFEFFVQTLNNDMDCLTDCKLTYLFRISY